MSGRTQKRAVSNSFPVSCLCSQKRYQLDEILLLMDGSSGMMCGIVSFIMQPSFCIQEWRETTQQTLGKRKFSCSSFRFSGKCINHILYIHLFIYYILYIIYPYIIYSYIIYIYNMIFYSCSFSLMFYGINFL